MIEAYIETKDSTKKLLLISLDGLSAEQFQYLSTNFGFLKEFTEAGINQLSSGVLTSAQAIWGELLSGQHWWETGCVGYALPRNSLNDLEIGSQSSYNFRSIFADKGLNFSVNVPLLQPGNEKRQWLSDGSFSSETASPKQLLENEPFKSYRPRPFSSPAYFLGSPIKGAESCFQLERHRLACAIELAHGDNWQIGIIRLSIFDHLCHLLGNNFLYDDTLVVRPALKSFVDFANKSIQEIIQSSANATICVMSAFSHSACTRRANLNLLLSQLGYCSLIEATHVKKSLESRHRSTIALSEKKESSLSPTALVTLTNQFQAGSTIAASPVHGAIYLNTKERFKDGLIEAQEIERTRKKVATAISAVLTDSGIKDIRLDINPVHSLIAPDLLIYATGLDFHDAYDAPAIDTFNHPLTCHTSNGFVCLKNSALPSFDTMSLNEFLTGCLK